MLEISDLRCEFASNPLGLDTRQPRFSWLLDHPERDQFQSAYQIQVASTTEKLQMGKADLWDSGKTDTSDLPLIEYAGQSLQSRQRGYWQVRVWDKQDRPSAFSTPAWFELALLDSDDWQAEWIGFPGGWNGKALHFRDSFQVDKPVKQARAYGCGLGWYELHLNGHKVGERVLDPAQTDYNKRVLYTTFDIQSALQPGLNVVGAIVGSGWYGTPILRLQLEILFEDGTSMQVLTGRHGSGGSWWRVTDGPIIENGVFDGEVYDARLERPGWDTPKGFHEQFPNRDFWAGAMAVDGPAGQMIAHMLEPIMVVETLPVKTIWQPKPGVYILDSGQNLAGWGLLTVAGPRGTQVTLRYAESLYEDGTVNQENLRAARACDCYILKGEGIETWEPRFTYHGFRYIQVEGFPGEVTLDSIQVRVVRSAVEAIGQFESDHPLLNQLYRVIWWTEASNLHGVPTDCPQRDERMGWLNDMAARTEEAIHNFDLSRLLPKWLHDIADAQNADGAISDTAPYRWGKRPADPVSVCYLLIPWLLYCHYGDQRVLREHYQGMKRWVDYLTTRASSHIVEYSHYGDWAPPLTESIEGSLGTSAIARNTPGNLVSTGFYAYSAALFSKIAQVLQKHDDAAIYRTLTQQISVAFNDCFWDEMHGGYGTNNQACNALALYMGLVPEARQSRVIANLVRDVDAHDYHLTTGNLCTKYVLEVLTEAGHSEFAFALATQTSYPSWGYMLANGATTVWERWEQATGRGMNSHNHPMFGSVGAWLYRALGGIQASEDGPGFRHFAIQPVMPAGMKRAQASLKTIRGLIESAWEIGENGITLHVRIPVGSHAYLRLPKPSSTSSCRLSEGDTIVWETGALYPLISGIKDILDATDSIIFTVGSGDYHFTIQTLPVMKTSFNAVQ